MELLLKPFVTYLLLTIGCLGILISIFDSRKRKLFAFVSIFIFVLYFGLHIIWGHAHLWTAVITLFGMVMLVFEMFIPSFGLLGLIGIVSVATGIIQSTQSIQVGLTAFGLCFVLSFVTLIVLIRKFGIQPMFEKLILNDNYTKQHPVFDQDDIAVGLEGLTQTPLRPSGIAVFNGKDVDVITEGGYIPVSENVKIISIAGNKVVVREMNDIK